MAIAVVPMNLRQAIEEVADMFDPAATAKGLGLVRALPPALAERVLGDPVRIR